MDAPEGRFATGHVPDGRTGYKEARARAYLSRINRTRTRIHRAYPRHDRSRLEAEERNQKRYRVLSRSERGEGRDQRPSSLDRGCRESGAERVARAKQFTRESRDAFRRR